MRSFSPGAVATVAQNKSAPPFDMAHYNRHSADASAVVLPGHQSFAGRLLLQSTSSHLQLTRSVAINTVLAQFSWACQFHANTRLPHISHAAAFFAKCAYRIFFPRINRHFRRQF